MNTLDTLISAVKAGGNAAKSVLPSSGIITKEGEEQIIQLLVTWQVKGSFGNYSKRVSLRRYSF